MTMREMVDQLNKWSYEYYVLDKPTVADAVYDALYDRLLILEKQTGERLYDSPTVRVGGEPLKGFASYTHRKKLYSLDKVQSFNELREWTEKVQKAVGETLFTVELKYDGLTVNATYDKGHFVSAATRGNGVTGEDVTEQVRTIKSVPLSIPFNGFMEVQGEGIMRLSALESYNRTHPNEPLKNARNAAAGAIRNLDPKATAQRNLDVVFYSTGYTEELDASSQTELVSFLSYNRMPTNHVFEQVSSFEHIKKIIERIGEERSSYDFLIDGVVIKADSYAVRETLGYTDKFPKWAVAYKFDAEQVITTLLDVDWQVGRTGKLTPIGKLEPVELCGATIKRATLNNFGDIERKKLKKHASVYIRRSNDVIPEVLGSVSDDGDEIEKPKLCPACGDSLIETGANLFCPNASGCRPQIVARITHYCSKHACDIEGLSDKTVEALVDRLSVFSVADLYCLSKAQLLTLEGFKDKKADNVLSAISKSKSVSLARFIYALGLDNVGTVTAKDLEKRYGSIEALSKADEQSLVTIDQIGEVVAQGIVEYFSEQANLEIIEKLKTFGINPKYSDSGKVGAFSGKKVVLTGSLTSFTRLEASKLIEDRGGELSTTVSKSVNLVIAGEDAGGKKDKAKQLGIAVVDEEGFKEMLL